MHAVPHDLDRLLSAASEAPVRGLRAWVVEEGRLLPPTRRQAGRGMDLWPAREPAVARCLPLTLWARRCRSSPGADCRCGIYATPIGSPGWLGAWLRDWAMDTSVVVAVGEVALWGEILSEENVCRCELAYPCYLRLVHNQDAEIRAGFRRLLDRYGIDGDERPGAPAR